MWSDCGAEFTGISVMLSVSVGIYCLELPLITMGRFKESLCADLEAASKLTEGLSDAEMKAFLDTIMNSCSEGQILISGVGEHANFLSILKHNYQLRRRMVVPSSQCHCLQGVMSH